MGGRMRWAKTSPQARAGLTMTTLSRHLHSRQEEAGKPFSRVPYVDHVYHASSAMEQTAAATQICLWRWFQSVQIREQSRAVMHLFHPKK